MWVSNWECELVFGYLSFIINDAGCINLNI